MSTNQIQRMIIAREQKNGTKFMKVACITCYRGLVVALVLVVLRELASKGFAIALNAPLLGDELISAVELLRARVLMFSLHHLMCVILISIQKCCLLLKKILDL